MRDSVTGNPAPWTGRIEMWPIERLRRYEANAKTHPPEQIERLRAMIREHGFTQPIVARDSGEIIAGHGRLDACETEGWTEVPVIVRDDLTDAQARALRLADNRLAELGEWDEDLLRRELADLGDLGTDLDLLGWDRSSLDDLFGSPAEAGGEGGGGAAAEGEEGPGAAPRMSLSDRFGIPPFSTLNAREGWWQARKAAWIALGIKSELGRGAPSFHDGATIGEGKGAMADQVAAAATARRRRKANAIPGGSRQPAIDPKTGKIVRADSKGRPIPGARSDADVESRG